MIMAVAMIFKAITDAVTLATAGNGSSYGIRSDISNGNGSAIGSGWQWQ